MVFVFNFPEGNTYARTRKCLLYTQNFAGHSDDSSIEDVRYQDEGCVFQGEFTKGLFFNSSFRLGIITGKLHETFNADA